MAHQDRGDRVAEHEGRHDRGGEALRASPRQRHIARGRQPAELHREQEDQHDAEPEIRRRDAPQREDVGGVVPGGVLLHRRDDAGGDADQQRDHDRHRGELQRHRQLLQRSRSSTGTLMRIDSPRSPDEHALDPVDVLHRDRLIEAVLLADLRDHVGIASSPAMTSAGSPGSNCCSEKISTDTKNSVGMSCSSRLAEEAQHATGFLQSAREAPTPTSPLVGEVGSRSDPGEGGNAQLRTRRSHPHPNPPPSRGRERGSGSRASTRAKEDFREAHLKAPTPTSPLVGEVDRA